MAAVIGIKIANGEFYPIVEEYSPVKRRLVLTTVHDGQKSVQIDLYKSFTRTMADALYIGSLLLEDIKARPKGEPSIELTITSTSDGNITANAVDMDPSSKREHQTLNVSLRSLDEDSRNDGVSDFDLEPGSSIPIGLYDKTMETNRVEKRKFPWLVAVCAALILTALGLVFWLLFLRDPAATDTIVSRPPPAVVQQQAPAETPPPAQAAPPAETPPAAPPPAQPAAPPPVQTPPSPPPVIQAPAAPAAPAPVPVQRRRNPPVASYRVPAVIPREGAPYTIRWGDTLWDIAEAFYRNPWLYPQIARFNNISNPDRIISGRTIRVPPRN